MTKTLPQQQLLLELLVMSGDIAFPDNIPGMISARTLDECKSRGWVRIKQIAPGFNKVSITQKGRLTANIS